MLDIAQRPQVERTVLSCGSPAMRRKSLDTSALARADIPMPEKGRSGGK